MYKGLARLVGMKIVGQPGTLAEEIDVLEKAWNDYDFFFVHFKYTDSRGEDGNFAEKVKMIEEFDAIVPRVVALKPTVLIVTATTARRRSWPATVGTPCPRCWWPTIAAPTRAKPSAKPKPSAAAWAISRPSTSCRWPWPMRDGWGSLERRREAESRKRKSETNQKS